VLHAARWKCRTQKIAKNSPSGHHRTNLLGYTFATKTHIDNGKKLSNSNISPKRPHNMMNFGPLTAGDLLASLGHPSKFQRVSHLGFVTAATSLNGRQPNFARCLVVSWTGTLYIHFPELLPRNGIVSRAKFTLRPSLAFLANVNSLCCRPSVCRLSVGNGRAPYSGGCNFPKYCHPLTSTRNFTQIVPGEPLRRGS